jgi:glycosyltransferase involved in cell wall biosynthesis
MRVLFIVPYTPNLIRVRPYNLIRSLSERGHQLTLLTLTNNHSEQDDLEKLADYCHQVIHYPLQSWRSFWNCLVAIPTQKPLQSVYSWQPSLADQIRRLVNGTNGKMPFDVAHVEHLRGARYGLHLKSIYKNTNKQLPIVWDSVDCISSLFKQASGQSRSSFGRWVTRFELGRTERYESWLIKQFSKVLVTSPVDKKALIELINYVDDSPEIDVDNSPEIMVLPNGVDLDYFQPDLSVARESATILISGKMSYHANVTMALHLIKEIMPKVWSRRSDVRVLIVGKDPPRELVKFSNQPLIDVTGTVPDVLPYLQRATIAAVPITYGAGIQNKVLEAMACATPVIASKLATEALNVNPGTELLIAEDSQAFAEKILYLLENPKYRDDLGRRARSYVESHHNWKAIASQLEEVYFSAAQHLA